MSTVERKGAFFLAGFVLGCWAVALYQGDPLLTVVRALAGLSLQVLGFCTLLGWMVRATQGQDR